MSGKPSRDKGGRGQRMVRDLLTERDWTLHPAPSGIASADFFARSPQGFEYAVEAKNCASLSLRPWRKQAKAQAKPFGVRWLLVARIPDHPGCFYVEGTEQQPDIWHSNERGSE